MGGSVDVKKAALKAAILDGWEAVKAMPNLVQNLVNSIDQRLIDCRLVEGRQTTW